MADLLLDDASLIYPDGTRAVSQLTLRVRDGELMAIVGPSGCGKTSVLRLIAGLERLSGGVVRIGGRVVNDIPTAGRDVAMVFEHGALYPHLTVAENLRFALELRHLPEHEIEQRVSAESQVLRLVRFLARKPHTLAAGQRHRAALGRATVRVPAVFLLDEPLTHLETAERIRLRAELTTFLHGLGVTVVYVTHDQSEAMAIGDRVAVMRDGRVEQVGEPMEVYRRPANVFVATFMGEPAMTVLTAGLEADGRATRVLLGNQRLTLPAGSSAALRSRVGSTVTVGIRPEHVTNATTVPDATAVLFSVADKVERLGSRVLVSCRLDPPLGEPDDGAVLIAQFPHTSTVRSGDPVKLAVDVAALSFFDPLTGRALWNPP
jgi:multiple sugar transport system ATP-binding protein